MKIAVVSDCLSKYSYYEIFLKYYSKITNDIFIFSYQEQFDKTIALGRKYDDFYRREIISDFIKKQLKDFDVIIRVDIDEILIPLEGSLFDYITRMQTQYVTAYGFDVFQNIGENSLDISKPLLKQRNYMIPNSLMNKTCITKVPLEWNLGFHFCNQPPIFNDLFLVHLKYADSTISKLWSEVVFSKSALIGLKQYYSKKLIIPEETDNNIFRNEFNNEYLSKMYKSGNLYISNCQRRENVQVLLPEHFKLI